AAGSAGRASPFSNKASTSLQNRPSSPTTARRPGAGPPRTLPGVRTEPLTRRRRRRGSRPAPSSGCAPLLELLGLGAVLLDLVLLLVELLQVAPVQGRGLRSLAQVGPRPGLVLRDRLQLPLPLAGLALRPGPPPAQLLRLLQALPNLLADDWVL